MLTSNLFHSFREFCEQAGIDPQTLRDRFSADPSFRELLIALEKGELQEGEFEQQLAPLLGVEPDGLIDGLFAGVQPTWRWSRRCAGRARAACARRWCRTPGACTAIRTTTCSTSCSTASSSRARRARASPRGGCTSWAAERAGVAAQECVFVDDLPFNLEPAEKLGMATVHHTSAETTIPELERLLGLRLT